MEVEAGRWTVAEYRLDSAMIKCTIGGLACPTQTNIDEIARVQHALEAMHQLDASMLWLVPLAQYFPRLTLATAAHLSTPDHHIDINLRGDKACTTNS